MSQNIFLYIRGEKQGVFSGEERDGSIECMYFEQLLTAPRDPSNGVANRNLKHSAITFRKQVDSTSPLFVQAMESAEILETVTFKFVPSVAPAGMAPAIFFVRLTNASVAMFKQFFSDTPSARYMGWQLLEEINLYYQKIEWGFNDKEAVASNWVMSL
jgi:type VI secretion system secreted protein Hcp